MVFGGDRKRERSAEFDQALRRSLRAAIEGDAERAQAWLERAVELDSSDVDAYQALARIYRDRGEVGRSIRMHQNLLLRRDLDRASLAQAKLELARDYEAGGFRDRALAALEELVTERPRDPEALETLALALLEGGDVTRAEALAVRLARLDPERAAGLARAVATRAGSSRGDGERRGLVSRFVARFGAKRREESFERELHARLADQPDDHAARIRLARLECEHGRPERARALLAKGLDRNPDAWPLHVEQGRLWLASGEDGEAMKAYAHLLDALERTLTAGAALPRREPSPMASPAVTRGTPP